MTRERLCVICVGCWSWCDYVGTRGCVNGLVECEVERGSRCGK